MIGLNCRGITKIWLNSNFAVNSFEKTEDERGEKFSEKEMVIKII